MKVFDWQRHLTVHQLYTWRAFEASWPDSVIHVVASEESEQRKKQGWHSASLDGMNVIPLKRKRGISQGIRILEESRDAIHVFGGFWGERRFILFIFYAVVRGIKVSIINEPYSTVTAGYWSNSSKIIGQIKVWLRPLLYHSAARFLRLVAKPRHLCVLALSKIAEKQFVSAGFASKQVFPFGYFVPKLEGVKKVNNETGDIRLVFVGSLLEIKGIDIAIQAIDALVSSGFQIFLDIYGYGDAENYIKDSSNSVSYKGTIPFGESQRVIAKYNALILPSRHDGWGVVVNEALLQGVPVIVSSHVGAKCIVEANGAGAVFKSGDVHSLRDTIKNFAVDEATRLEYQRRARKTSEVITPERGAAYMQAVFEHFFLGNGVRPLEPWCF